MISVTKKEQAMSASFSEIVIFDLAKSSGTRKPGPSRFCELRQILIQVGFLYGANHSIFAPTIERLVKILPHVFALLDVARDEGALVNSPHFPRLSKFGSEQTATRADQRGTI